MKTTTRTESLAMKTIGQLLDSICSAASHHDSGYDGPLTSSHVPWASNSLPEPNLPPQTCAIPLDISFQAYSSGKCLSWNTPANSMRPSTGTLKDMMTYESLGMGPNRERLPS